MQGIDEIREEHEWIMNTISKINSLIGKKNSQEEVIILLKSLSNIWHSHEEKEEVLFSSIKQHSREYFPEEMLIEQHRELRGHWKVLSKVINLNNPLKLEVALDTDGKMLISKFIKHIDEEEMLFDKL